MIFSGFAASPATMKNCSLLVVNAADFVPAVAHGVWRTAPPCWSTKSCYINPCANGYSAIAPGMALPPSSMWSSGYRSHCVFCLPVNLPSWVEAKLLADDGAPNDFFGYSFAFSGDTAVIGAMFQDDKGDNSGSAYVFTSSGSTWSQ